MAGRLRYIALKIMKETRIQIVILTQQRPTKAIY
jgi:hypothetical protein